MRWAYIFNKIFHIIFIWTALLFFISRVYSIGNNFGYLLFWLLTISMLSVILYQIFFLKSYSIYILIEIMIFSCLLFSVYSLGYVGLRGSDSYFDYNLLKNILNNNHFSLTDNPLTGWPMIHILSSEIIHLTKIDSLTVAKFLPFILSSLIIFPLYLLIGKIYKDEKSALLSCLIYVTIPQFMTFHSLFVRQTYAVVVLIFLIFIIYQAKKIGNIKLIFLSLLFIPSIILGHHLTSMMIILILFIYILSNYLNPFLFKIYFNKKNDIITVFLIILICTLSYWIYITQWQIGTLFRIINQLIMGSAGTTYADLISLDSPIITLKGNIIFYGFFIFHFLFAFLIIIKIFFFKNKQKIEDIAFSMFFFLTAAYGFLSLFFISGGAYPQRMLSFGWLLGVIPLVTLILVIKKPNYKKIFVISLTLFILFNIYNISDAYIEGRYESTGVCTDIQDYIIAKTIKFPENIQEYYGDISVVGAIYDVQLIEQRSIGKPISSINDLSNFSKIIIINENRDIFMQDNLLILREKSIDNYLFYKDILELKNNANINKIGNLGNRYVLKGVR